MYISDNDSAVLRYHLYTHAAACNDLVNMFHVCTQVADEELAHMSALAKELSAAARRVWLDTNGPRVTE